ncbi:acyltransferase family protein [Cyanobium sp. LEGE 06143]|uniref:acyltransferase family protein n=1 Tax=Cyanobium sp. LEGE 06143 TaxID=945727 RepID=UPI00187E3619|nr:acyltransferase family protein [Cyanobium sp. LEGE 06143]
MSGPAAAASPAPRCHALDGARVLAVLLLIPFHAAAVFYAGDLGTFYVSNPESSAALGGFLVLVHQWHMPLFFFLAGSASWYSLRSRGAGAYLRERLQRLLLPLGVGILVLVPPQVYLHDLQSVDSALGYLRFYPHFFDGIRPAGHFEWAHLWFLAYLLVITLLCLPLLGRLSAQASPSPPEGGAGWRVSLGSLLLLALPLMLSEALLRPRWPGFQNLYDDWANLLLYLLYFVYGYLFCHQGGFWVVLDRRRRLLVALAMVGMAVFLALTLSGATPAAGDESAAAQLFQAFRGWNSWCAVLALVALARRFLKAPHPLVSYGSKAAMPLYLLHQPVLVGLGWWVVPLPLAIGAKFALICAGSLLISLALYEGVIRRLGPLSPCFGLVGRP